MDAHKWNKNTIVGFRSALKLSQRDFAKRLGTKQQRISEWERGFHSPRNAWQELLSHFERKCIKSGEITADWPNITMSAEIKVIEEVNGVPV